MAFTGLLEDRILIRELYGAYADCSWRNDAEGWADLFTPDGVWTSHLFDCHGRAELIAEWKRLWTDWNNVMFLSEIGSIEIDGDSAQVRSYAREAVELKSGGIFKLAGSYADELVRSDGNWRFKRRAYQLMFTELPG